ncbi:MAG: sodium-independent anion transporter [Bacteroidetes bacterium]|nr:MAG: sodium-independent anion transporter [Bacteroidota bacterium]
MNTKTGFFSNLKGDAFGGITAGIVALPLALAFGAQTELGAIAGLYGAIALGILAALFGGTRTQISGPTAPMTVVAAVLITEAVSEVGSLTEALPIIITTFILAGILQVLLGVLKLGKYIKYIPYPVVSGFMSGIGVIIVVTQLFPFFGITAPAGGAFGTLKNIREIPEFLNFYSVGIAVATIAIIYLTPRITKKIPASLIALILISIIAYFAIDPSLFTRINSEGALPTGLPSINLGFIKVFADFGTMVRIFEYSATLAALGAIDSLLTSVVADNMTKEKHDSNRELIGQGIGNIGAGLIGGLPGAGATMRTVININSGGKNRLSGVIAGLLLTAILLGLGTLVGHVPNAVLAGILITVGIGIIDYKGISHIKTIPRSDAVIMIIVLALTVFVDLLMAVAAGMVLSSLLFMKKASDLIEEGSNAESLKDFAPEVAWSDEVNISELVGNQIYIKHINGPLFFGATSGFQDMMKSIPDVKVVVIRMGKVPYVDQSGLYAMEDALLELKQKGINILFTGLYGQAKDMFEYIGIVPDLVSKEECLDTIEECEIWLKDYSKNNA